MKRKRRMGFSAAKFKRAGSSDYHFKSSNIPIIDLWPLGLAISRSLITVRAASQEWWVWELHDSGLKKMRRKPSKRKTSCEKYGCEEREQSFEEVMGKNENIYIGKVQSLASQEKLAGAVLAGQGHALNWNWDQAHFASWFWAALPIKN